jgi:hypothetical protein
MLLWLPLFVVPPRFGFDRDLLTTVMWMRFRATAHALVPAEKKKRVSKRRVGSDKRHFAVAARSTPY